MNPGAVVNQTVYIKNTSTGLSLTISMTASNWTPTAANGPITVAWNKEDTDLQPGASIAANIILTVSPTIVNITNFNVQINISGTNP
ncbi:MAG: hypothetical protein ABSD92_14240 [Candidatus Bathyarchaeia archaeon]